MSVLVSLSGGMDSATVLARCLSTAEDVQAVAFRYGSKHNEWELAQAKRLAAHYGVRFDVLDLSGFMSGFDSALMKSDGRGVPEGHYTAPTMSQTVVPGRNMIFASILAGLAWSRRLDTVALGVHAGDHAVYPDCRPEFVEAMQLAIEQATDGDVTLYTPFLHQKKANILAWGLEHGVPYELTRTCYKDQELACGKCGSCRERLEAFSLIGETDPLKYESET